MRMKNLLAVVVVLGLAGCDQYFRYPCQDPANWNEESCKKPLCEVNRDCPEHIFKGEERATMSSAAPAAPRPPAPNCGACK